MGKRSTSWHKKLTKDVLSNKEAHTEYEEFKMQLELALQLKAARQKSCLTQEEVAKKMSTQKTSIARLEAAGGKLKHSPSLLTLIKYANAIGYALKIHLIPKLKSHHKTA